MKTETKQFSEIPVQEGISENQFAEYETAKETDRKLVQISEYREEAPEDGSITYYFSYDEEGLLTEIEEKRSGDYYDSSSRTSTFVYNEHNQLIERERKTRLIGVNMRMNIYIPMVQTER